MNNEVLQMYQKIYYLFPEERVNLSKMIDLRLLRILSWEEYIKIFPDPTMGLPNSVLEDSFLLATFKHRQMMNKYYEALNYTPDWLLKDDIKSCLYMRDTHFEYGDFYTMYMFLLAFKDKNDALLYGEKNRQLVKQLYFID